MAIFSVFDDLFDFMKGKAAMKDFTPSKTQKVPFSDVLPQSSGVTSSSLLKAFDPKKDSWTGKTIGEINEGLPPPPKPYTPPPTIGADEDPAAYFKKNWKSSGSVGGHGQPTAKQVGDYTAAYEDQGKPAIEATPKGVKPAIDPDEWKSIQPKTAKQVKMWNELLKLGYKPSNPSDLYMFKNVIKQKDFVPYESTEENAKKFLNKLGYKDKGKLGKSWLEFANDHFQGWEKAEVPRPEQIQQAAKITAEKAEKEAKTIEVPPGWNKVGGKLGTNEGGTYTDPSGAGWYVKKLVKANNKYGYYTVGKGEDLARNELLTNALYKLGGTDVPQMQSLGPATIASKLIPGQTLKDMIASKHAIPQPVLNEARKNFAIDAWLANWDFAGQGLDNLFVGQDGKVYRIDTGGGLDYRAQGQAKTERGLRFTSDANEVNVFRGMGGKDDPKNPDAEKIYKGIGKEQMEASAARLAKVTPEQVAALVKQYGPKDPIAQKNLTNLLIRRRDNVVQRITAGDTGKGFAKQSLAARQAAWAKAQPQGQGDVRTTWHGLGGKIKGSGLKLTEEGGFWSTPSWDIARTYAASGKKFDVNLASGEQQGHMAEFVNNTKDYLHFDAGGQSFSSVNYDIIKKGREGYYPGIIIDNIHDALSGYSHHGPQTVVITLDPTTQRLKQANFDPAKASLNDLLASGAAIAFPAAVAASIFNPQQAKADEAQAPKSLSDVVTGGQPAPRPSGLKPGVTISGAQNPPLPVETKMLREAEEGLEPIPEKEKWAVPLSEGVQRGGKPAGIRFRESAALDVTGETIKAIHGEAKKGLSDIVEGLGKTFTSDKALEGVERHGKPVGLRFREGPVQTAIGVETLAGAGVAGVQAGAQEAALQSGASPEEARHIGMAAALLGLPMAKAGFAGAARRYNSIFATGPLGMEARAIIRQGTGYAARQTARTAAMLEPFYRTYNAMGDAERTQLYAYIEGRSTGAPALADPQAQALADQIRTEFQKRRTVLENMDLTKTAQFIEDYFPHMWENQTKAANFAAGYGAKQGTKTSLRKRSIPTIADGLAAGLKLRTQDPIEAAMLYVSNMDRFIAHNGIFQKGRDLGHIKYYQLGSGNVPQGWEPLKGRFGAKTVKNMTMVPHAPEEFARIYNNSISRGFEAVRPPFGRAWEAIQKASNVLNGATVALSAYHQTVMLNEAAVSSIARGVREIAGGIMDRDLRRMLRGAAHIPEAIVKPFTNPLRGSQMKKVYQGVSPGTKRMEQIVDIAEKSGARLAGYQHAPDYRFSASADYWKAWQRGSLGRELKEDVAKAGTQYGFGAAKVITNHIGRIMSTIGKPLFEHYIPTVKNGAFYDAMDDWLNAHPTATEAETLEEGRKIWDSIDNRFGEMVQDNIFWHKMAKQLAMLGMLSYSWNVGTVRELGGGVADIASNKGMTARATYAIALPIWVAMMNALYTRMKTGKAPESVHDLLAGRTGGTVPGVNVPSLQPYHRGLQADVPERALIPGYQKDVFGWWDNMLSEGYNKLSPAAKMAIELGRNKDWKDDVIYSTAAEAPSWLQQYFSYFVDNVGPISLRTIEQGQKTGSKIGLIEQIAGIREAPKAIEDPEGTAEAKRRRATQAYKKKLNVEKKIQSQYGGPQE